MRDPNHAAIAGSRTVRGHAGPPEDEELSTMPTPNELNDLTVYITPTRFSGPRGVVLTIRLLKAAPAV